MDLELVCFPVRSVRCAATWALGVQVSELLPRLTEPSKNKPVHFAALVRAVVSPVLARTRARLPPASSPAHTCAQRRHAGTSPQLSQTLRRRDLAKKKATPPTQRCAGKMTFAPFASTLRHAFLTRWYMGVQENGVSASRCARALVQLLRLFFVRCVNTDCACHVGPKSMAPQLPVQKGCTAMAKWGVVNE